MTLRGDHTLEHSSATVNLLDHSIVENCLGENSESPVLCFDVQLLGLEIDFNIIDLGDTALFSGLSFDPFAELLVRAVTTLTIFVVLINKCRSLEIIGQTMHASLDSSLGCINGPLDFLLFLLGFVEFLSFGVDPLEEFVAASIVCISIIIAIPVVGIAVTRTAIVEFAIPLSLLASLAIGFLRALVLLALLWRTLENEGGQLVAEIDVGSLATCLAVENDVSILDVDDSLGVLAVATKDKFADEAVEIVLKLACLMCSVDDPAVVLGIEIGLSTKFEAKVLDDV